jgi:hypothetical protein
MTIRLAADLTQRIDEWSKANGEESRSEAMRRLLELGLTAPRSFPVIVAPKAARANSAKRGTSAASDMAGEQIDKLGDSSATAEERQMRKRRLLKGPKEFRDLRVDHPKPKGTAKRKSSK